MISSSFPWSRSGSAPADGEPGAELLGRLAERLEPDDVAARMRRRFVQRRRPILDGQLAEMRALDSIGVDTLLERRPTVICELEGSTLLFEGKRVGFPEDAAAELEAVAGAEEPFCAAALPGELDEQGRLVLVRRLVREGFLRRSAAGA